MDGFTDSLSMTLDGGIPAKLQLVSRLLLLTLLDELASVMMDSLSLSLSRSRSPPHRVVVEPVKKLGDTEACGLGARDVSAVEAMNEFPSW